MPLSKNYIELSFIKERFNTEIEKCSKIHMHIHVCVYKDRQTEAETDMLHIKILLLETLSSVAIFNKFQQILSVDVSLLFSSVAVFYLPNFHKHRKTSSIVFICYYDMFAVLCNIHFIAEINYKYI